MSNGNGIALPSTLFEYIIRALVPRSKNVIDLRAYNIAQGKIESKRKGKIRRGRLWLAHSNNNVK